jgi:hypothetical protein
MDIELYQQHAAPNTVPQGNLLRDVSPKTMFRAAQTTLAKPTLTRKRLPIRLDLDRFRAEEFGYDTSSAEQVEKLLMDVPADSEGRRWIHQEDGVLFNAVVYLDVPYDEFVDKVDISRVGDCFRDVLGINTEVVRRDEQGRPTLQIERIAALAQPNYTAFLGKDELDVYKLEHIQYGEDEQRNWMRTVCSPNGSTWTDNGYLGFSRSPGGKFTKITFVAHQAFPRPRMLVLSRMDRWEWFRTLLTEDAYRRFWGETLANIVARYEGKEIGIGRPSRNGAGHTRALAVAGAAGLTAGALFLASRRRAKSRKA